MKIAKRFMVVILVLVFSSAFLFGILELAWFLEKRERLAHEQEATMSQTTDVVKK